MVRDSSCSWSSVRFSSIYGIRPSTPSGDSSDLYVDGSATLVRVSSTSWSSVRDSSISGLHCPSPCGLPPSGLTTAGRVVRFSSTAWSSLRDSSTLAFCPQLGFCLLPWMHSCFWFSTRVSGAAHAYREKGRLRKHGSSSFMRASLTSMTDCLRELASVHRLG